MFTLTLLFSCLNEKFNYYFLISIRLYLFLKHSLKFKTNHAPCSFAYQCIHQSTARQLNNILFAPRLFLKHHFARTQKKKIHRNTPKNTQPFGAPSIHAFPLTCPLATTLTNIPIYPSMGFRLCARPNASNHIFFIALS